jgi:ATP-dependent Zn protease
MLDPALTRAGRLDRHIKLGLPDEKAVAKIMRFHLRDDLGGDDLSRVARRGVGGTGADVEQWVRGARRRARHERRKVSLEDLVAEQGVSSTTLNAQDLTRMAFHEAGHVVAGWLARPENMVLATLYRAGGHGGFVRMRGGRENYVRADVEAELRILLAGRASEEIIFGEASSGSGGDGSSDLAMATRLALASLTSLGFGQRQQGNLVWLGAPGALDIEATLRNRPDLAEEVGAMLEGALASARVIIEQHVEAVDAIARHLLAHEYATGDQITAIMAVVYGKTLHQKARTISA